jgi:hypothetical protein
LLRPTHSEHKLSKYNLSKYNFINAQNNVCLSQVKTG